MVLVFLRRCFWLLLSSSFQSTFLDVSGVQLNSVSDKFSSSGILALRSRDCVVYKSEEVGSYSCPKNRGVTFLAICNFNFGFLVIHAHNNEKGLLIAKAIVKAKIITQALLLQRYNIGFDSQPFLRRIKRVKTQPDDKARTALFSIEGEFSQKYSRKIGKLFPNGLQTDVRESHGATNALNNIFNLSYEVLRWEVYKSILSSHLDPYLGYLHSIEHSKPSLVCDVQEPYRAWIDGFLVEYCRTLREKDLQVKFDGCKPRIFLRHPVSSRLIAKLNEYLNSKVMKQRTHKYGSRSRMKTIIQEDTERLAGYIRGKLPTWEPTVMST